MTGIYKITNTINNKSYIGLSKNIEVRWKTHTSNIQDSSSETILRRAFAKYGLRKQISKPGKYGNFMFEVLEECTKAQLRTRELYYIQKEQPSYNIQTMPPNRELYLKNISHNADKSFVQYHNFDILGYFPGISDEQNENGTFDCFNPDASIEDTGHYIATNKSVASTIKGAEIYLIIGISVAKYKYFYLWSTTLVEELEFFPEEQRSFNLIGEQQFIEPIILNDIEGFSAFKKSLGNFAFGLSSIEDNDFLHTLKKIKTNHTAQKITQEDFLIKYYDSMGIQ